MPHENVTRNQRVTDEEAIELGETQRVDRSSDEALSRSSDCIKTDILDEFVELTGSPKHAVRLLGPSSEQKRQKTSRSHKRVYNEAVREALILLWVPADRICGKRFKAHHSDLAYSHGESTAICNWQLEFASGCYR